MNRQLENTLRSQLNALLPGDDLWPSYSNADTYSYWFGWEERTPRPTQWALAGSVIVIKIYTTAISIFSGHITSLDQALAAAERSRSFAIRQAMAMIKSIGCLAYFSDSDVFELGMNPAGEQQ